MVARTDAELLVGSWALDATRRQGDGREFTPMLDEFEHGYVVWVSQPEGQRAEPGSGARRVIDRVTGEITTWGSIPAPMVADQYRRHRQEFPAGAPTIDPVASIRALARPQLLLNTAVHLTLQHDRRMRIAYGVKGDQELNHHPLVREYLDAQPIGHLSRGAERHAEMIVVSDVLHSYDAATGVPTSLEVARELFRARILLAKRHIRPDTALNLDLGAYSCHSCVAALVHIGLHSQGMLDREPAKVSQARPRARPDIPAELLPFLVDGRIYEPIDNLYRPEKYEGAESLRSRPPAGLAIHRRWVGCSSTGSAPGLVHRVGPFDFIPVGDRSLDSVVEDFGRRIGARTYPVGRENMWDGWLVGDEYGRVFALDQAGEWFIGGSDDEALVTLFYGREQRRIRDDGTW